MDRNKYGLYNYNGFKLINLELIANTFLGTLTYNFIDQVDIEDIIYTTVIIGPNGTGKSNLFRTVIELFRELYNLQQGGGRTYQVKGIFKLRFALNGDIYDYSNKDDIHVRPANYKKGANVAYLLKNGSLISFAEAFFPLAIVANSIMITDKYPVFTKEDTFPQYKYLGVRNTPQNASTRSYVRKTVDYIIANQDSAAFKNSLKKTTEFLGVNEAIEIFYFTINGNVFFNGKLDVEGFNKHFEGIQSKYINKPYPPQKLTYYKRLSDTPNKIEEIINLCNKLSNENRVVRKDGSSVGKIIYNIVSDSSFLNLKNEGALLNEFRQLGIISPPEISLNKGDSYSIQESSSGEYHLFSSIVGLMATVKMNSLIFLDEPECSLHPNWQMKYLSFIRALFSSKEYGTSHMIVATHSHFLISDLKGNSSKIIGLKKSERNTKTEQQIEIVDLPYNLDTYGWSAEDILYNVFNVKSSLNYYLQADLTELLGMISNNIKDVKKIENILVKLRSLPKRENDPLQEIIIEASEYLDSIK